MNERMLREARELARRCLASQNPSGETIDAVARKIVAALPRYGGDRRTILKIAAHVSAQRGGAAVPP